MKFIELLPSSSGAVGGRGVLPTGNADTNYNYNYKSSSSARPDGSSGGGGIGNSGRASRLDSASGTRPSRLLSRQEEGLSFGEGSPHLTHSCPGVQLFVQAVIVGMYRIDLDM